MPTRGIIAAISPDRVIGLHGRIPWHYSEDLKRFKRLTLGSTIIMGRKTWESIGSKPLPGRRNVVLTRQSLPGVECFARLQDALTTCADEDVWFIGGAGVFAEALEVADRIDLTWVPDEVDDPDVVRFPEIDESVWEGGPRAALTEDARLTHQVFVRRNS